MLSRRLLVALPLIAALGGPALAGEGEGKDKDKEKGGPVGQYVDLQPVGLPVVVEGQLANYVFVNIRLNLTAGADTSRWRAKEPYFRDALVRLGFGGGFNVPGDNDKLDGARLTAALTRQVLAITGPGVIKSVELVSQTPSHRSARRPS
jgi:hypothetical protein